MPDKSPDIWAAIWTWLSLNFSNHPLSGAFAAFFMSVIRVCYLRKNQNFCHTVFDGLICGALAHSTIPIIGKLAVAWTPLENPSDVALFVGIAIGYIGTDEIRKYMFKFLHNQVNKGAANDENKY
ncbi:phage holin, lambda family [Pasteurellaceae bacterium 22721_9_1]